jgi:hypothetical protein
MAMNYNDLLKAIQQMTPKQRSKDLTIHTIGESYPAELLITDKDDDVLGPEHPYFKIENEA